MTPKKIRGATTLLGHSMDVNIDYVYQMLIYCN